MRSLAFQFRVSHQYISTIIKETLNAIQSKFLLEAIPEPTKEMLEENAKKFYERWNYPNCVGAIDGKHVRIVCPAKTGSLHYNYKDFFLLFCWQLLMPIASISQSMWEPMAEKETAEFSIEVRSGKKSMKNNLTFHHQSHCQEPTYMYHM